MEKHINKAIVIIIVLLIICSVFVFYYYSQMNGNQENPAKNVVSKVNSDSGNICIYDNAKAVCNELYVYPPIKITDLELEALKENFNNFGAEIVDAKELRGMGWITYRIRFKSEERLFALKDELETQQIMVGYNLVEQSL